MGNTSSSNTSVHSNSIRSRSSRQGRADEAEPSRLSQAVSFYQTPPGSFDLGQRPISDTSTAIPDFFLKEAGGNAEDSDTSSLPAAQEDPKKWKPGVYSLVNVQSGTVLDLSGGDDKSLIGFPAHGGKNQQVRSVIYKCQFPSDRSSGGLCHLAKVIPSTACLQEST